MEIDPNVFKRKYTFELSDYEVDAISYALTNMLHNKTAIGPRPHVDLVAFFQKLSRSNALARKNQDLRDPFQRGDL